MSAVSFDFVYMPLGQQGFKNVHITFGVSADDVFELRIFSQSEIDEQDTRIILNELQNGRFKKMNVNLARDCKIFLVANGVETEFCPEN